MMGRTTVHRKKPRGPRDSTHSPDHSYMSSAPTRLPSPAALSSSSSRPIRFPSRCLRNLAVFLCVGAALRPEDSNPHPPHASSATRSAPPPLEPSPLVSSRPLLDFSLPALGFLPCRLTGWYWYEYSVSLQRGSEPLRVPHYRRERFWCDSESPNLVPKSIFAG